MKKWLTRFRVWDSLGKLYIETEEIALAMAVIVIAMIVVLMAGSILYVLSDPSITFLLSIGILIFKVVLLFLALYVFAILTRLPLYFHDIFHNTKRIIELKKVEVIELVQRHK